MKPFRDTFAERLTIVMGDLTQEQAAKELGICRPTLACYLSRKRVPSAETLYQICEKTGCSSDWLLGLADGKWLKTDTGYRCSKCGATVRVSGMGISTFVYCYGCGRRMTW